MHMIRHVVYLSRGMAHCSEARAMRFENRQQGMRGGSARTVTPVYDDRVRHTVHVS